MAKKAKRRAEAPPFQAIRTLAIVHGASDWLSTRPAPAPGSALAEVVIERQRHASAETFRGLLDSLDDSPGRVPGITLACWLECHDALWSDLRANRTNSWPEARRDQMPGSRPELEGWAERRGVVDCLDFEVISLPFSHERRGIELLTRVLEHPGELGSWTIAECLAPGPL